MSRTIFRALLLGTLSVKFGAMVSLSPAFAQEPAAVVEALAQPAQVSSSDSVVKSDGLNHHQWLRLAADGSFWGTLAIPAGEDQIRQSGIEIALIHHGQAIAMVTSAEDG